LKLFIIYLFIFILNIYGQIESNIEIRFQQAMEEEQIIGNLERALLLYKEILQEPDLSDTMSINIQLRMAVCYKKLGNELEAKKIYDTILTNSNTTQEIKNFAEIHSRDIQKRLQIFKLKMDLKELQEANQKAQFEKKEQLEKEVKELQDKIQTLEKSRPIISNNSEESKKEVKKIEEKVEEKVKDTVAKHLHQVGEILYNQGFLSEAQEKLKNALSIDANNPETRELLDRIEKILLQQQENQKLSSEKLEQKAKEEVNGVKIYSEEIYDVISLWKRWAFSEKQIPEEKLWSDNLSLLIKAQLLPEQWKAPARISYKDQKFYINQTTANHNELKEFWNSILPDHVVISANINILKSTWNNIENQGLFFSTDNSGIIYSQVNSGWQEKFLQQSRENFNILKEDVFYVLEKKIVQWDNINEIPLVQGEIEQKYNFKIFEEGVRFILNVENLKNIELFLRYQKLQRPIPLVMTHQGPFQSPIFLTQKAKIKIDMQFNQDISFLIGTFLLDNIINTDSNLFLFFLVQLHVQKLSDFFKNTQHTIKENAIEENKITKPYDITFLQVKEPPSYLAEFRKNIETDRHSFLLNYFKNIIKEKKLDASLELLHNTLIVYGSEESQKCIDKTIQLLHENLKTLCRLKIYIYSKTDENILTLKKSPIIQEIYHNKSYHIYTGSIKDYFTTLEREKISRWTLSYILENIHLGNLQKSVFQNSYIRTFMENIEWKEKMPIVQTNVLEIPEGILLDLRVVLLGEEGDIFFTPSLFFIKNDGLASSNISRAKKIVFPFPELEIIRENFHWKFKKDYFYIISGLKSKTSNQFCCIIIPEIVP